MTQSKKRWVTFGIVVFVLMVIFAFTDLSISKALFNIDSKFGKFIEITAHQGNMINGSLSAAVLIAARDKKNTKYNYIQIGIFGGLFLLISFFGVYFSLEYMGFESLSLQHFIGWIIYFPIFLIIAFKMNLDDIRNVRRIAIIGLLVFIGINGGVYVLKNIWGRVRFREMVEPYEHFTKWFIPQFNKYADSYIEPESFPSGHTANATAIFMVMIWSQLFPKLKDKRVVLFVICCLWTFLVALGRIIMGAHFASDVTAAITISIVGISIASAVVNKIFKYDEKTSLLP